MQSDLEKMRTLITQLNEASVLYYDSDDTIMSDAEYDLKIDALMKLENRTGIVLSIPQQ